MTWGTIILISVGFLTIVIWAYIIIDTSIKVCKALIKKLKAKRYGS